MENTKACTKCGIEKPLSCFSKRSSSKDGLRYDCKECVALHAKSDEEKANLQLLCPTCNLRKSAKHPVDFMRETGRLL